MVLPMSAVTAPTESSDVRDKILATGQRIMGGKGFSAVGLNEILTAAGVPKGSFYHYFGSKEAFGEALLENYFEDYLADMDRTLHQAGGPISRRLENYFQAWQDNQSFQDCQGKCLAVKLGAEVADLSEAMRASLKRGTSGIIGQLAGAIEAGAADGSLSVDEAPEDVAQSLYQLWLGASVMVKIVRNTDPFHKAMTTTRRILNLSP
jgi:TetR/AcrR family transcriptional repressor of nem operon